MKRQWRIVGLGDYLNYPSYFTLGVLEGAVKCGAWFRPVPLFGQSLQSVEEQINFFKPHILLCHMIFNKQPHNREQVFEMLKRIKSKGVKIFYHAGDARNIPRYEGDISSFVDGVLLNSGLTEHFSNIWKVPCYHWPYGCFYQEGILDKAYVPDQYRCEVAFGGALSSDINHVHYGRTVFVNKLIEKGVKVKIFPNAESGNTRFQTAELASGADVVLGVGMAEHIPLYLDVRPFQYIGAGAVYAHTYSEVMKKFFQERIHYIGYDISNPMDFIDQITPVINEEKIRKAGFKFCQKWHSMEARMKFVLDLVSGKADKPKIYLEDVA